MQRDQILCDAFDRFGRHQPLNHRPDSVVPGVEDARLQTLRLDACRDAVDLGARPLDDRIVRDEDETEQVRTHREDASRQRHCSGPEDRVQNIDVLPVLLDGGGDAVLMPVAAPGPFALAIDRHAVNEVLALAHPSQQHAIEDEMVDLGNAALVLDPEVVDRHVALALSEVELDYVGRVAFADNARARPDLPFDPLSSRGRQGGTLQETLQPGDVGRPIVSRLDASTTPGTDCAATQATSPRTRGQVQDRSSRACEWVLPTCPSASRSA